MKGFLMRKVGIVIAASAGVLFSTFASQACIMMGVSDQGGDCAAKCEAYGKPYWLCMLGSTAPKHGAQGDKHPAAPAQR